MAIVGRVPDRGTGQRVATAFADCGLPVRHQTTSRVAMLTGVSHKDVACLRRRSHVFWGPRQAGQWCYARARYP